MQQKAVALRKESVDRNLDGLCSVWRLDESLSARRAWIEMLPLACCGKSREVALRKESVDRNMAMVAAFVAAVMSLSARRAWIEILRHR